MARRAAHNPGGISEQRPAAEPAGDGARQRLIGLAPEEVYTEAGTHQDGLTELEARSRLDEHGPNRIEEVRGPSLTRRLLAQFVHLFALLLWAGSALASSQVCPPSALPSSE